MLLSIGNYYISSIYGPSEQIVLYIDPLNSISQMIDIEKIAQRKGEISLLFYESMLEAISIL